MKRILTAIIALLLVLPAFAAAQNTGTFRLQNYKPKGIPNNGNRQDVEAIIHTDEGSLLGFSKFVLNRNGDNFIYSYTVRNNGIPQRTAELFTTEGTLYALDAVWMGDHGIVYWLYSDSNPGTREPELKVMSRRVDGAGNPVGEATQLMSFDSPADSFFSFADVHASAGNEEVLLSVTGTFQQNSDNRRFTGFHSYAAWFIRTGSDGELITAIPARTPGGAKLRTLKAHPVRFTDGTWFVPVSMTAYKKYYVESQDRFYTEAKANFVYLLTLKEGKRAIGRKLILKEGETEREPSFQAYKQVLWLPGTAASTQDGSMGLLVSYVKEADPDVYYKTDYFTWSYYLVYTNSRGRTIGQPAELVMPEWDMQYEWEDGDRFRGARNSFSNVVNVSDELYFIHSFSINYSKHFSVNSRQAEYEQRLMRLDEMGNIEIVAVNNQSPGVYNSTAIMLLHQANRLIMLFDYRSYDGGAATTVTKRARYNP